jgi:hypothetical protein
MVAMVNRYRSFDPFAQALGNAGRMARPATVTAANDPVRPARSGLPSGDPRSVLEARYPKMAQAISLLWGHPEMNQYFDRLWLADGTQTPLDPETMSELMLLAQIHQLLMPQRPQRSMASIYGAEYRSATSGRDVWDDVPKRR